MNGSSRPPVSFMPWVEGVARQIGDPVQRLRFLRVAAPCVPPRTRAGRRLRVLMYSSAAATALFLIVALIAISLSLIKGRPARVSQPSRTSAPAR